MKLIKSFLLKYIAQTSHAIILDFKRIFPIFQALDMKKYSKANQQKVFFLIFF